MAPIQLERVDRWTDGHKIAVHVPAWSTTLVEIQHDVVGPAAGTTEDTPFVAVKASNDPDRAGIQWPRYVIVAGGTSKSAKAWRA